MASTDMLSFTSLPAEIRQQIWLEVISAAATPSSDIRIILLDECVTPSGTVAIKQIRPLCVGRAERTKLIQILPIMLLDRQTCFDISWVVFANFPTGIHSSWHIYYHPTHGLEGDTMDILRHRVAACGLLRSLHPVAGACIQTLNIFAEVPSRGSAVLEWPLHGEDRAAICDPQGRQHHRPVLQVFRAPCTVPQVHDLRKASSLSVREIDEGDSVGGGREEGILQ